MLLLWINLVLTHWLEMLEVLATEELQNRDKVVCVNFLTLPTASFIRINNTTQVFVAN